MSEVAQKPVLLIEDDVDLRDGLRMLLNAEGYHVEAAKHGAEALRLLEQIRPFVILLDVMMPIMGGRDFLEAIEERKPANAAGVPIILLTAVSDRVPVNHRVVEVVTKPINFDRLFALLRRLSNGGTAL